jgi:DHA1 family inner membrane transport protein
MPFRPSVTLVLSTANFVIGMGGFMVIGLLPPFAKAFDITPADAGWLVTAYALGYTFLSPVLVSLTGKIGRRRVLAAALLAFGISCLLAAVATTPNAVYLARVCSAGAAGLVTPVAAAVAASLSPPDRRGRALSAVFAGLTIAQVFGVPLGGWLAYTYGWQSAFLVVFALSLPVSAAIWMRVPQGLSLPPVTMGALGQTLAKGRLMFAVSFTIFLTIASYVIYTYIAPVLTDKMGYGRDGVALVLLLFGLGAVAGNIIGGLMTDRIGGRAWLIILTLALAVLTPIYSMLPLPDWIVFLASFAWTLFGFSFMSAQQSRLIALAPERTQVLLALNASSIYLGAAIGASVGAFVISVFGLGMLGIASSVLSLIAAASVVPKLAPPTPHTDAPRYDPGSDA